jgi:homoserine O-acetyltransferase
VAAALASVTSPVIVAGIEGDRLYPLHQQAEIAAGIPTTVGGLRVIDSHAGHDGFLVEEEQVFALVAEAAELATEAVTLARLEPATASVDVSHERAAC